MLKAFQRGHLFPNNLLKLIRLRGWKKESMTALEKEKKLLSLDQNLTDVTNFPKTKSRLQLNKPEQRKLRLLEHQPEDAAAILSGGQEV